jgi:hypothetical protein
MTLPIQTTEEPRRLQAGDTWEWIRTLIDFPASLGWVLKYYLRGATAGMTLDITATANSNPALGSVDDFAISVPASSTSLPAGEYAWSARVEKGAEKYTVDQGTLTVTPDVSQATTIDNRSHNRKVYESICAVIEKTATRIEQEYEVEGRKLMLRSPMELQKMKAIYSRLVRQEERNAGQRPKHRRVVMGFQSE